MTHYLKFNTKTVQFISSNQCGQPVCGCVCLSAVKYNPIECQTYYTLFYSTACDDTVYSTNNNKTNNRTRCDTIDTQQYSNGWFICLAHFSLRRFVCVCVLVLHRRLLFSCVFFTENKKLSDWLNEGEKTNGKYYSHTTKENLPENPENKHLHLNFYFFNFTTMRFFERQRWAVFSRLCFYSSLIWWSLKSTGIT